MLNHHDTDRLQEAHDVGDSKNQKGELDREICKTPTGPPEHDDNQNNRIAEKDNTHLVLQ